jgi:polyisoprenoid-binding protein YceI
MSWKIDPAHTRVNFVVKHMMVANVNGEFKQFEGEVEFDEENPENTRAEITISTASIDSREPDRDAHLRSADFLESEKYPTMTFKSTSVEVRNQYQAFMHGNLTIKDVTKPVTLDVEFTGQGRTPYGKTIAGFNAHARINRKEWGLVWNVALETGGWLVGEDVGINIEMELVKEAEAEAVGVN